MKFLSILLLLGGYMLVYGSVAKSGRFATEPWEGLFHDAYDNAASGKSQTPSQPAPPTNPKVGPSPLRPRFNHGLPVIK